MSEKRDKWGGGGLRVLAFVMGGAFAFWAARSPSLAPRSLRPFAPPCPHLVPSALFVTVSKSVST